MLIPAQAIPQLNCGFLVGLGHNNSNSYSRSRGNEIGVRTEPIARHSIMILIGGEKIRLFQQYTRSLKLCCLDTCLAFSTVLTSLLLRLGKPGIKTLSTCVKLFYELP